MTDSPIRPFRADRVNNLARRITSDAPHPSSLRMRPGIVRLGVVFSSGIGNGYNGHRLPARDDGDVNDARDSDRPGASEHPTNDCTSGPADARGTASYLLDQPHRDA